MVKLKKQEKESEEVTFMVSETTVLAIALILASIIVSGGLIYSANTLKSGLSGLAITTTSDTGGDTPQPSNPQNNQGGQGNNNTKTIKLSDITKSGFLIGGKKDAPITIVEYSDFQCPFCRSFWTDTLPSIKSEYIETGKVKFVYKHFPLRSIHPSAQKAAEAFECAVDQGLGVKMHDKIFEKQNEQGRGTISFSVQDLKNWAKEIEGLDSKKFDSCLDSGDKKSIVDSQYNEVTSLGGTGTPSFVIGKSNGTGQLVVGAQPFTTFKKIIDGLLKE